jgi:hypothetical protein
MTEMGARTTDEGDGSEHVSQWSPVRFRNRVILTAAVLWIAFLALRGPMHSLGLRNLVSIAIAAVFYVALTAVALRRRSGSYARALRQL